MPRHNEWERQFGGPGAGAAVEEFADENPFEPIDAQDALGLTNPPAGEARNEVPQFEPPEEVQKDAPSFRRRHRRSDPRLSPDRAFPAQKGMLIYDNQQSYGDGALVDLNTTSLQENYQDKIRWQHESLWPAYYTQEAVPSRPPSFVRRDSAALGAPGGSFNYAQRSVHSLKFVEEEYNPGPEFGEYNELFNLYIDTEKFLLEYGDKYLITRNMINGLSNDAEPSEILNLGGFSSALREIFGLHVKPALSRAVLDGEAVFPEPEEPLVVEAVAQFLSPEEEQNLIRTVESVLRTRILRHRHIFRHEIGEDGEPTGLRIPYPNDVGFEFATSNNNRAKIDFFLDQPGAATWGFREEFTANLPPSVDQGEGYEYKAQAYLFRHPREVQDHVGPDAATNDWIRGIIRVWSHPAGERWLPPPAEYEVGIWVYDDVIVDDRGRELRNPGSFIYDEFSDPPDWVTQEDNGISFADSQAPGIPRPRNPDPRGPGGDQGERHGAADRGRWHNRQIRASEDPTYFIPPPPPPPQAPPVERQEFDPGAFFGARDFLQENAPSPRTPQEEEFLRGFFMRYQDHTMRVPGMLDKIQTDQLNLVAAADVAFIKPVYNYMLLDYERMLETKVKDSSATHGIPNMYVLTRESLNEETVFAADFIASEEEQVDFKNFSTIGGLIRGVRPRIFPIPGHPADAAEKSYSNKQYFCSWTNAIGRVLPFANDNPNLELQQSSDAFRGSLADFRNLIIPPTEVGFIKDSNKNREAYPMFNHISFTQSQGKRYAGMINLLRLTDFFAQTTIPSLERQVLFDQFNIYGLDLDAKTAESLWYNSNTILDPQAFTVLDILGFWKRFDEVGELDILEIGLQADANLVLIGENVVRQVYQGPSAELIREQFRGYMRRFIESDMRPYQSLLGGNHAKSEPLFYRVEKKLNDEVVQNFYIPNVLDEDIFDYIDTQVLYGRAFDAEIESDYNKYNYNIYAEQMVVGNDYSRNIYRAPTKKDEAVTVPWNFPLRYDVYSDEAISDDALSTEVTGHRRDHGLRYAVPRDDDPGLLPAAEEHILNMSRNLNHLNELDVEIGYFDADGMKIATNINLEDGLDPGEEQELTEMGIVVIRNDPNDPGGPYDFLGGDPGLGRRKIKIGVLMNNKPSVKMIEVPIYESGDIYVFDKPPAPPDVNFIPYRAVDSQALITMNEQANTYLKQKPIPIDPIADAPDVMRIMIAQSRSGDIHIPPDKSLDQVEIVYGNDDLPAQFLVYRTSVPPRSYEDYKGALHYIADLTNENGVPEFSSSSLKDFLEPNRKYYYTFRVKDVHGHLSNPTTVFQVELVNNAGAIYLLVDVYEFPTMERVNFTKELEQYIMIRPSLEQERINHERSGMLQDDGELVHSAKGKTIQLGPDSETVWGKKLKFRFISKKTGRRFDLNVDFETDQDRYSSILPFFFDNQGSSGTGCAD